MWWDFVLAVISASKYSSSFQSLFFCIRSNRHSRPTSSTKAFLWYSRIKGPHWSSSFNQSERVSPLRSPHWKCSLEIDFLALKSSFISDQVQEWDSRASPFLPLAREDPNQGIRSRAAIKERRGLYVYIRCSLRSGFARLFDSPFFAVSSSLPFWKKLIYRLGVCGRRAVCLFQSVLALPPPPRHSSMLFR